MALYKLSDGTNNVDLSPTRGLNVPETRIRKHIENKDGLSDDYEWGNAQKYDVPLININKAKADQLSTWWENMTVLTFAPEAPAVYAHLNGSTEYFYRTDADFPEAGITGDLTAQGWVKPDNVSGLKAILGKYTFALDKRCYAFAILDDELSFVASPDGGSGNAVLVTTGSLGFIADVWYYVAVVYDASEGTADFYVNGIWRAQGTGLPTSIADKTSQFEVGTINNGAFWDFDGGLYNLALFDDIRTATEIKYDYEHGSDAISNANLIAQWFFNEDDSAAFIDNTQGDAGRDLVPYDGGDETFDNVGRTETTTYQMVIDGIARPLNMWHDKFDEKYAGMVRLCEVSSQSFSSSHISVSKSQSCSPASDSESCGISASKSCSDFIIGEFSEAISGTIEVTVHSCSTYRSCSTFSTSDLFTSCSTFSVSTSTRYVTNVSCSEGSVVGSNSSCQDLSSCEDSVSDSLSTAVITTTVGSQSCSLDSAAEECSTSDIPESCSISAGGIS